MAQLAQPSFSAGEISPKLHSRVDLQRYGSACAKARNFIVLPEGGLQNRAGTRYCAKTGDGLSDGTPVRVIPFRFSTGQAYCVELGERYARFFVNGAPVLATGMSAWDSGTTYANKAFVTYQGVTYKSKQAGNLNHTPAAVSAWWVPQTAYEIETPWIGSHAMELRFTQSGDVMTLAHIYYKPRQLRRLGSASFDIIEFDHREGPFENLNADDAVVVSSNGRTGVVTITANKDIFTADMIGQLLYIEIRDLSQIRPWVLGDRGVTVGALRRNDGKTYTAVTVPSGSSALYTETGNRAPVHDKGRAWDGGGDLRDNGSVKWWNGIEWEYRDSGYGIVQFTGYTDARTMTAEVKRILPDQVVGGVGTPAGSWNLTGDGTTKTFAIAGATGTNRDYAVTISGVPVASDPPYSGGSGGSGGPGGDLP